MCGYDEIYVFNNIIRDRTFTANYIYPTQPELRILSNYTYAYSDDPNDNTAYNRAEIYSIFNLGLARDYGFVAGGSGARIKMAFPQSLRDSNTIENAYLVWDYVSTGHYELVSGGASNGDWVATALLSRLYMMRNEQNTTGGWNGSAMRQFINYSIFQQLDPFWRNFFKQHVTLASSGGSSTSILRSNDSFSIPSVAEMGYNTSLSPFKDEIWSSASEIVFPIFTDNISRIKRSAGSDGENTGAVRRYWLRSVRTDDSTKFAVISPDGGMNTDGGGGNPAYAYSNIAYGICLVASC